MPAWGEERMSNMIATGPTGALPDAPGRAESSFLCDECGETMTDRKIRRSHRRSIRRALRRSLVPAVRRRILAGPDAVGPRCEGRKTPQRDGNSGCVSLTPASSHVAVLNQDFGLEWPADIYLEGGDQYRGWLHSSRSLE